MNYEEYIECVFESGKEYIDDCLDYYDTFEEAYRDMFNSDTVTGAASGSFYCNSVKAEQALAGVLFDNRVANLFKSSGYNGIPISIGPEECDVILRALILPYVKDDLEEYWNEMHPSLEDVIDDMDVWLTILNIRKINRDMPDLYAAIEKWQSHLTVLNDR